MDKNLEKMTRNLEFLKHHVNDMYKIGWFEYCRKMRKLDEAFLKDFTKFIQNILDKGDFHDNERVFAITMLRMSAKAFISPIVEYVIDKNLSETFKKTAPVNPSMAASDVFKLPYECVAIRSEDDASYDYITVTIKNGMVYLDGMHLTTEIPCDIPISGLLDGVEEKFKSRVNFMISSLAYITNNNDVEIKKNRVKLLVSNKAKKQKHVKFEEVTATVGGHFKSALVRWEQAQAQATPGDPTGRVVRPHCRAGHWHTYWVGKGRTTRSIIFVHPCLVNAKELGDVEIERSVK